MAPTQPSSGPADPAPAHRPTPGGEPPAPGPPEGFEHQQYEHGLPEGNLFTGIAGVILDATQRGGLADGLSMRPAGDIPHTNAGSYEHPELKRMIDGSKAAQVHELGQMWNDLGNEIMDFGASLQRTATSSEAVWVGQAGNAARATLSGLATWSDSTGQGVQYMGTTMRTQAEAAATAKLAMPEPVPYDPAEYQNRMNSTINPIEWVQIIGDAREQAERHNAAHAEAIRVTETYSTSLQHTNGTMPAFAPPPEFGNGDTGLTSGRPTPGGAGGGGTVPQLAGTGGAIGDSPGEATGRSVGGAPTPTPGQAVPGVPGPIPGGRGPTRGGVPADGGRTGVPAFLPAAAAGFGGAGAGGRGPGVGGGRGGGTGGGFGPRGSAGAGTSNPPGHANPPGRGGGPTGTAEGAAGKGAAGMGGRTPGSGGGGAFPPMAGPGRGRGEEDTERKRPSYLIETEDIWGDGRRVAPPVIGEDPPEYYRKGTR